MGQKQSSSKRDSTPGMPTGVSKRSKKDKKRKDRPNSTPDFTSQHPNFSFGTRPSDATAAVGGINYDARLVGYEFSCIRMKSK